MAKLADSPYGEAVFVNGELILNSHVDDPTKFRGGVKTSMPGRSLVAFSGDRIRSDGVHEECVLVQFKESERFGDGSKAGEITVHLRRPHADGDSAMVHVMTIQHDRIQLVVPVEGAPMIASPGTILRAPGGETELHMQGADGNLVTYDVRQTPWVALWSSATGKIRNFREDGRY